MDTHSRSVIDQLFSCLIEMNRNHAAALLDVQRQLTEVNHQMSDFQRQLNERILPTLVRLDQGLLNIAARVETLKEQVLHLHVSLPLDHSHFH
jgi:hypothetical protein